MLLNDRPVSAAEASQQSALTLAYLGDAVFELLVREMLVINSHKTNGKLHVEATHFVSAEIPMPFPRKTPTLRFTNAQRGWKLFSGIFIFRGKRRE